MIFSKLKIKCVKAFNGQKAIEKVLELSKLNELPRMIILDYHMPVKNGVETTVILQEMFKNNEVPRVPIIGCTAFGSKNLMEEWIQAGASDIWIKPVNIKMIQNNFPKYF